MAKEPTAPERVQAAFRQLSTSAVAINEVSDELRKSVSEIEASLKKLNLGVPAWVTISQAHNETGDYRWIRQIGYTRIDREWRIVLRIAEGPESWGDDEEEMWAFNDAPRWMRVEAVGKIPELLESLVKQVDETTKKIKNKTAEAKGLTAAINASVTAVAAAATSADTQRK